MRFMECSRAEWTARCQCRCAALPECFVAHGTDVARNARASQAVARDGTRRDAIATLRSARDPRAKEAIARTAVAGHRFRGRRGAIPNRRTGTSGRRARPACCHRHGCTAFHPPPSSRRCRTARWSRCAVRAADSPLAAEAVAPEGAAWVAASRRSIHLPPKQRVALNRSLRGLRRRGQAGMRLACSWHSSVDPGATVNRAPRLGHRSGARA